MLTVALAFALAAGPAPFRDEAAGFEVMFVGPPQRDQTAQVVRGVRVVTHRYTDEVRGLGLVVSWADHPEADQATPAQRLAAARASALQGAPALEERTLGPGARGAFGLEFSFERDGVRISQRLVLSGQRLYQVLAVRPVGARRELSARTFLDSFRLLGPRPAPVPLDAGARP